MTEDTADFGFGSMVRANVGTATVRGEVVATGPDNRDLDDDQYIIAVSADDVMNHDHVSQEEIIRESSVEEVLHD